jgi:hypothetical protein
MKRLLLIAVVLAGLLVPTDSASAYRGWRGGYYYSPRANVYMTPRSYSYYRPYSYGYRPNYYGYRSYYYPRSTYAYGRYYGQVYRPGVSLYWSW